MNEFTERQQKILDIIASSEQVTCEEIISKIGYSRRTIIKDIKSINLVKTLILSTNRGYSINKDEYNSIKPDNILSVKEEHALLRRLIMLSKTYTFEELADKMFVSESTLNKMLKSMNPLLAKYSLSIVRKEGKILVEGKEYDKRKLINKLINEEIDNNFKNIYDINEINSFDYADITKRFSHIIKKHNYYVDDSYRWNLELNIMIALQRIKSEIYIDDLPHNTIDENSLEYTIAKELCDNYQSISGLQPKKADITYIALLLIGQLKPIENNELSSPLVSQELLNILDRVLFEAYNHYMITSDYHDLLYPFALHISALIKRARAKQEVINDMAITIKQNSPFVYEVAVYITEKLEKIFAISISEEEIGFIAIHVGFSINNSIANQERINIQLLCNNYYNTIENIQDYLNSNYGDAINLETLNISTNAITINTNAELIISTKVLNIIGKRLVIISPFMSLMDKFQIDNAIKEISQAKESSHRFSMLSNFFNDDLFFNTDEYKTKDEVIKFLANKLVDFGVVDLGFTESVIKRESFSSTCFFDTFAIPHSLETNAKQSMFCILVSKEGINWDDHLIHIVIMIAIQLKDRKEFVNIYNGLIRSLWNNAKLNKLASSKSLSEFIDLLK